MKELLIQILKWWEENKDNYWLDEDEEEHNLFDTVPDFVVSAKLLLRNNFPEEYNKIYPMENN